MNQFGKGSDYDPVSTELHWQDEWRRRESHAAPDEQHPGPSSYVYAASPFTSGDVHIGHVRSYSIADAYARLRRATGDAVLYSMGYDSFGLPAEEAAARNDLPPAEWIERCRERMTAQFERIGFSLDWGRTFASSDPEMYRWSQWLFLEFLRVGLVYRATESVDWCPRCETVLARLQVEDGCCWRCHGVVSVVEKQQWFLRVTAYGEENEEALAQLPGWDELMSASQRTVSGRVDGVEIDGVGPDGEPIVVFTPYPDAVADACFVALSPRHPEIERWLEQPGVREELVALRKGGWQRASRKADSLAVLDTGMSATVPGAPPELPVVISNAVDGRYGSTLVLGIPSLDQTDAALAAKLQRGPASGALTPPAEARPGSRFRLRDFAISRQRPWGTPIPTVTCTECGVVPLSIDDLPVELPVRPDLWRDGGNPLADPSFASTRCPSCAGPARRESDTLDCHFDGIWLAIASCARDGDRAERLFDHPELRRWLPGRLLLWGADGGGYIFDQRMMVKALRDIGPLDYLALGEIFERASMHEMVHFEGQKMSKHLGNVVDPVALVDKVGADAVRFAVLHAAAPRKVLQWSEETIAYARDFVTRSWSYAEPRLRSLSGLPGQRIDAADSLRARLLRWCGAAVARTGHALEALETQRATRALVEFLDRIEDFETRVGETRRRLDDRDREAMATALLLYVRLLAPITPHLAEQLWAVADRDGLVVEQPWPQPPAVGEPVAEAEATR